MVYVSITGLRLKSPLYAPLFWWHAIPSMVQAKGADGNISADARTINGVKHTLTVWRDQAAMRAYLVSGAHGAAMRQFHRMATGHTFGFLAEAAPGWDEVHRLWLDKDPARQAARAVGSV
jgi:hypothetical protein